MVLIIDILCVYVLGCIVAYFIVEWVNKQPTDFTGLLIPLDRCLMSWFFVASVIYIFIKQLFK